MRIGTERLIRALIGAGMVIGHEVGRDMTASRASRGAGIGCGAVAPVRGPLAARAIHAFVVAVAVHQLLANEGSGCGERSEEHTSELQSLMRISYAVFCLKKKNNINRQQDEE